jgi:aspartate/methionine/tyrosine aminotransferase/ribosomal protein S18 acetylase RimI-like enzyme
MIPLTPIQPMRSSDDGPRDECARLMAASSPWSQLHFGIEQCRALLGAPALKLWSVADAGRVIGFVALRPDGIEGEPLLEYVCVHEDFRGKGIGRKLIGQVEEWCRDKSRPDSNIYLFVSDFNTHAIRLYERLGYVRVGAIPDYNVYGQTEYLYRKVLGRPRQQEQIRNKAPGGLSKRQGAPQPLRDLNAGYARMKLPGELRDIVVAASTRAFDETGGDLPADIDDHLHKEFLKFVCMRDVSQDLIDRTFSTFSGSIALDRVFGAVRRMHSRCESMQIPLTVLLPEPSLDLWQHLLRDRSGSFSDVQIIAVREFESQAERTSELIKQLECVGASGGTIRRNQRRATDATGSERKLMVIVDSPSNPQGFSLDRRELKDLARACKKHDAVLVLDHCFLLAGVHFRKDQRLANAFADLNEAACDWYAIWDTGKSLDLAGDKVAFITASSDALAAKLRSSMEVIQPTTFTAVRSLTVLRELFENRDGFLDSYLSEAARICRKNLEYIRGEMSKFSHCTLNEPAAGSFVLFSCNLDLSSMELAAFWQEKAQTGVAVGKDFYAGRFDEGRPPFVRLSLYKPTAMFKSAVDTAMHAWPDFVRERIAARGRQARPRLAKPRD